MTVLQQLQRTGELARRAARLREMERACTLCPRLCGIDRNERRGPCGVDSQLRVSTITPHFGEEPPITGTRGAGAVFFTGCHLRCLFCQNFQISQLGHGRVLTPAEFADAMLQLQARGVHNLDLVSPTHYLPGILEALDVAVAGGFQLPIVYNSNGYERVEVLQLLDGIVDVYLPDAKYADDEAALIYSAARDYDRYNEDSLVEMFRQVGNLRVDDDGIALRGLIVRHLVLPGGRAATRAVLERALAIAGPEVHVSLMGQYQPVHRATRRPEINRRLSAEEYEAAFSLLDDLGIENGWCQEVAGDAPPFLPDFHHTDRPFRQDGVVVPVLKAD